MSAVFIILVVSMINYVYSQQSDKYHSVTGFIDMICIPEFSSSTWNFTATRSAIECSAQCSQTSGCKGVFYNRAKNTCFGGSHVFSENSYCQVDTDSVYITIESIPYNETCDGTVPCSGDNMECWDGKCVCEPGYSLWPSRTARVADCGEVNTDLGNTFQFYSGRRLGNFNIREFPGLSLEECKTRCVDQTGPECTGIDVVRSSGYCALNAATPLEHPQSFSPTDEQDYYFRNCQ